MTEERTMRLVFKWYERHMRKRNICQTAVFRDLVENVTICPRERFFQDSA